MKWPPDESSCMKEDTCPHCGMEEEEICFHENRLLWYCYDCWPDDWELIGGVYVQAK